MSRYGYAGNYKDPTEGFYVKQVGEVFQVWIRSDRDTDGSAQADRRHNRSPEFEEHSDAAEWIDGICESFEQDHDDYCEETHYAIAQMERY